MPEGPEIRREADAIARAVANRPLVGVELNLPALARWRETLGKSTVLRVDTHGKAMLTRFACGLTLYSHNQLYGRWLVRRRGEMPNTHRTLRVALHARDWSALLYSATDVRILREDELAAHPFLRRLGPDVLDPQLDWRTIAARLRAPAFRGRALGALYLDQGFIAGIGNYLRSEILHYAGLHPAQRPQDLAVRDVNTLARQTIAIARRGAQGGGHSVLGVPLCGVRSRGTAVPRVWHGSSEDHRLFAATVLLSGLPAGAVKFERYCGRV